MIQVPKVVYCVRLGTESVNIPWVLEGSGAESGVLCARGGGRPMDERAGAGPPSGTQEPLFIQLEPL